MKHKQVSRFPKGSIPWYQTLAFQITVIVSLVLIVVAVVTAFLTFLEMRQSAVEEMEKKGFALANALNSGFETLLVDERFTGLQRIADNSTSIPDVLQVTIVSRDGMVMASSKQDDVGKETRSSGVKQFLQQATWEPITYTNDDGNLVVLQPLRWNSIAVSVPGANVFGVVEVVMDRSRAEMDSRIGTLRLLGITLGGYLMLAIVLLLILRGSVVSPLHTITRFADQFRQGNHVVRVHVSQRNELGLLARSFNHMADEVIKTLTNLERNAADLEHQRTELAHTLDELQSSTSERIRLSETIRELSIPIISLYDQIILITLVGTVDTERARQFQTALLQGIKRYRSRKVIVDLTGVPIVDTQVAASLLEAARAARLIGNQVIIVGITPDVAQSIVHLGVDLSQVVTLADLRSGVVYALKSLGLEIQHVQKR